jgi:LacI family transcriptional regulator
MQPSLTTIRQDKTGLGAAAGDALLRMLDEADTAPPITTLPVELIVRESSGAVRPGGRTRKSRDREVSGT